MQTKRNLSRPTIAQFILLGVGLLVAVAAFIFLSGFVACWRLTSLPGIAVPKCGTQPSVPVSGTPIDKTPVSGTPVAVTPTVGAPSVELPPPWDGASRVSVLVMGYDYGDWSSDRNCPCRSDTMIVLTIDPLSHTAGMISVPRDMWVNIPGFGYNKINAALFLGDLYKLPGGGAELAKKTVENFLGIPIQYYALVDFTAFEQMIDTIGGVCFNVPEKIDVGVLDEHGTTTVEAGYQCLSGKVALGYARDRHTANGDVDRSGRQMQVILGIRNKVLANLPALVTQAPQLYSELSTGIQMPNLTLDDILRLAMLAKDIPLGSIQQGVIDYSMMQDGTTVQDGQTVDILRPYPDKIRELVDRIFGGGAMKPLASGDPTQMMQQEAARVVFVNGSGVAGLAKATSDFLKAQGMNVVGYGNTTDYPNNPYFSPFPSRTIIIVHSGKPYAMAYLMALMKFNSNSQLKFDFSPNDPVDIIVALGSDWGSDNPLP